MGKLNISMVKSILMILILLIILFTVLADTAPDVGYASDNVTDTASSNVTLAEDYGGGDVLPIVSFFKKKGIVLLAVMAGIIITVIAAVLPKGK